MQITNNKYNTMPEQVQENKDNIKSILAGIKEIYSTTETLTEQSETIAQSLTTVPRGTKKGFLIDAEANLFNILSVVENVVYIKYWANVKGKQGPQGPRGETGSQGPRGETGPQGPRGETGVGVANITDLNLVVGEPSVIYDTEDGITITSQGEIIAEGGVISTPTVEQNIPIIAGNGLTMDATEDGKHVDVHLSAETQSNIARALKTPIATPTSTKLIAVDNTNSQEMIGIGNNLILENGVLNAIGGGGVIVEEFTGTTAELYTFIENKGDKFLDLFITSASSVRDETGNTITTTLDGTNTITATTSNNIVLTATYTYRFTLSARKGYAGLELISGNDLRLSLVSYSSYIYLNSESRNTLNNTLNKKLGTISFDASQYTIKVRYFE